MCNNPGTGNVAQQPRAFQEGGPVYGTVGGEKVQVGKPGKYQPGITELAYGLMQQGVELPPQVLAQFTPAQLQAFQFAQSGIGSYQPFLDQASELTEFGVGALESSLAGTQGLAGQVPGAIAPGQAALASAATGAEAAAAQGVAGAGAASQQALESTAAAQQALQEAGAFGLESAQAGIAGLAPGAAMGYMNPFEEAVVQRTMDDIARQGRIAQQGLASQAVAAGAFGGSRGQQAQSELQRNILEQQARSVAQLRQSGFESAAGRAMQGAQLTGQLGQIGSGAAASAAQAGGNLGLGAGQLAQTGALQGGQLGLDAAQAAGNLGLQGAQLGLSGIQAGLGAQQQAAGIGQGIAGLGQQQVGLAQAGQQLGLQDVNTLLTVGQQQQQQEQAALNVDQANQMQQIMQPYQQLAFASDIITGAPSSQMSTMTQPGPSLTSQAVGLGIAAPGLIQSYQTIAGS